MKCDLCNEQIEEQKTEDGKVYWDMGHNAWPVAEGRCCDICHANKVIPARITDYRIGRLHDE